MLDIDAVILAGGDYPTAELPTQLLHEAPFVACCDGGANEYIARGHMPDIIIGDGDSLDPIYRERYAQLVHHNPDQETNDLTKAVEFLQQRGVRNIAVVGATGRREDHAIGNIALMAEYLQMGLNVRIYTDYGRFVACRNEMSFDCNLGQAVSIFNISAEGFSAEGLMYPLYDFTKWWQGTLNRTTAERFTISAKGDYLVFIAY